MLNIMDKKSVTQETVPAKMSFLQLPGGEHDFGNSRVPSATSSVKSGSIHFATTVRMLAPVIWSRIQSRQKVCMCHRFINCCFSVIWRRFDVERLARPSVFKISLSRDSIAMSSISRYKTSLFECLNFNFVLSNLIDAKIE